MFSKALARIGGLAAEPTEIFQTSSFFRPASMVPKSPSAASPLNAFKTSSVRLKKCRSESYCTLGLYEQSRDSSVGIMIRLWSGQPRKARFDFWQTTRGFLLFQCVDAECWAHPPSCSRDNGGSFPWVEWKGREADKSASSTAEVNK